MEVKLNIIFIIKLITTIMMLPIILDVFDNFRDVYEDIILTYNKHKYSELFSTILWHLFSLIVLILLILLVCRLWIHFV